MQVYDPVFGHLRNNSVKIKRLVEVFQWVQKEEKNDDTTRYWYEKEWKDEVV